TVSSPELNLIIEPPISEESTPITGKQEQWQEEKLEEDFYFEPVSAAEKFATEVAIGKEIVEQLPRFEPEIDLPEAVQPELRVDRDELGKPSEAALVLLDAKKLLAIVRQFFFAVEEVVGRDSAFLLMKRAKYQIEVLYPALDLFEVVEDYQIV